MTYQNDIVRTIKEHRSLFIIIMVGSILWVIYLRYLLARKSIESHKEVEKFRLQLEYEQNQARQIAYIGNSTLELPDDPTE